MYLELTTIALLFIVCIGGFIIFNKFFTFYRKEENNEIYLDIKRLQFDGVEYENIKFYLIKKYGVESFEATQLIAAATDDNYEFFKEFI